MEVPLIPSPQTRKRPIAPELVALDPTKIALMMEPRPLPHLPALISHFISVLPLAWTFRFVGSPSSISILSSSSSLSNYIRTGKLVLIDIPRQFPIDSPENISAALTNVSFYRDFLHPAEWVFFFESDSIVCAASEHSLDDWVAQGWTWIGAPWHPSSGARGGLSLRHIPVIIKVLEDMPADLGEDRGGRWLGDRLFSMDEVKMPDAEVQARFSVESGWADRPFAYHLHAPGRKLAEIWGDDQRRRHIFEYCPEMKMILNVNADMSGEWIGTGG